MKHPPGAGHEHSQRDADTRVLVKSLSDEALAEFEAYFENRVSRGTATLADFGRLAVVRHEIAGRRLSR